MRAHLRSRIALIVLPLVVVVACACGGSASPASSTASRPAAGDLGPAQPQAARIMTHIQYLAGKIGTRLAGSQAEAQASSYATQQLESWGYTVELEPFPAQGDLLRVASVSLADGSRTFQAVAFYGSGAGSVSGKLLDAGTGQLDEFPPNAQGAIVLMQRQDVPFADMVSRAIGYGAIGAIVANKEPGRFLGAGPPGTNIPVVAIDQADGATLRAQIAKGPVDVQMHVDPVQEVTAHNVIARPPDGHCRTVAGGHYDSVPVSVGATDNASGAATVLELARAAAAAHLAGDCFVLFSGEEEGLLGSDYLVQHLAPDQRAELRVMLNFDVTAGVLPPQLIGDEQLAEEGVLIAKQSGVDFQITTLGMGYSSDHASFIAAGIPALLFTADDQGIMHTPQDSLANVKPYTLQPIANLGFDMLRAASQAATPAATP